MVGEKRKDGKDTQLKCLRWEHPPGCPAHAAGITLREASRDIGGGGRVRTAVS